MKITQRLILLFIIVTLSFLAFIYVYFKIKKQETDLYNKAEALQRRQIINAFIGFKRNNLMKVLDDFTSALEKQKNSTQLPLFAYDILKTNVKNKRIDLVQIYNSEGSIIFQDYLPEQAELSQLRFPKQFFRIMDEEKNKYFTEPWKQVFMQVGSISLFHASDSLKTQSPFAYLIIAKLWDSSYLEDFSQTLDYNVRLFLTEPKINVEHPYFNVNIVLPLIGWTNYPVAWLRFRSANPFMSELKKLSSNIVYGIFGFIIVFLVLQFALLYYWINAPLSQISSCLEKGSPEYIERLTKKNNEFGAIARLIKRFFQQNQQLRIEMEERRKTEMMLRQAQKMESIGTLAGGIAHDFNNLITIISGYIALTNSKLTKVSDKPAKANLEEAMRGCLRAKNLIEKILTFSRQSEKTVQPVMLETVVKDTLSLLKVSIPSSIVIKTYFNSQAYVLADPTEMQQVVMNITTNAYHAMRYQGGTLEVEIKDMTGEEAKAINPTIDSNVSYVCMSFKDTGTGIPQEILDRIFDPYFTTKAVGEGTGLGLSIVHGIVTDSGGFIRISSVLEQGTEVTVILPTTSLRIEEKIFTELEPPFKPANIFFIDDEPALAELFRETLDMEGHTVTAFSDSTTLIEHFTAHPQDCQLLIADIAMPSINGIQLAEKLLAMKPDLPIILYTGFSDEHTQTKCNELGIKRLLVKPIMPDTLAKTVQQVLAEISG